MQIQPVLAPWSVSLADFMSSPMPVLFEMGSKPVAVMHQDKPLFYVLSPLAMQSQHQTPLMLAPPASGPVQTPVILPPAAATQPAVPGAPATPVASSNAPTTTFRILARKLVEQESQRLARGEICSASVGVLRNRLDAHVLPHFGSMEVGQVKTRDLDAFVQRLSSHALSSTTLSQYMVVMRKLLKLARREELLVELPEMPRIKLVTKSRSMLNVSEYHRLIQTARRLSRQQCAAPKEKDSDGERERFWVQPRHLILPPDLAWVISFMVNSFVRPSDIKFLQHRHITVVRAEHLYLRLNLPETKRHDKPIVTLRPAVRVYEAIQQRAREIGRAAPEDYIFLPDIKDRQYALALLGFWLKWVMREAGIARVDSLGAARTLYSLRHTAIMYRLLYGQGIDMLTLARNARTSVEMIERFYASTLSGEMNVGMLQSKRARN